MNILRHARLLLALCAATLMALDARLVWSAQPAPSQYTILEVPGAPGTGVSGINNRGQIAGSYPNSDFTNGYAFVYDKGVYNTLVNPLGVLASTPFGINDRGQVVGQQLYSDYNQHGFLYDKGVYTIIDHPDAAPPVGTYANGINNRGQIVGSYAGSDGGHGFVYEDGVFTTFDVPGSITTGLTSINEGSQVVGYYFTFSPDIGLKIYTFVYDQGVYTRCSSFLSLTNGWKG